MSSHDNDEFDPNDVTQPMLAADQIAVHTSPDGGDTFEEIAVDDHVVVTTPAGQQFVLGVEPESGGLMISVPETSCLAVMVLQIDGRKALNHVAIVECAVPAQGAIN